MKKDRRKLIVGTLVATMALTSVLLATGCSSTEQDDANPGETPAASVAATSDVDQQALEVTFAQAWQEVEGDEKGGRCRTLVDKGLITHDQIDEFKEWLDSQRGPENCDGDCDDCDGDHEGHGADVKDCDGDCDGCEQAV